MRASIVDLRYKTKDILRALERKEKVSILYRGKIKGVISPVQAEPTQGILDHPFFGMSREEEGSVDAIMEDLRGPRYDV